MKKSLGTWLLALAVSFLVGCNEGKEVCCNEIRCCHVHGADTDWGMVDPLVFARKDESDNETVVRTCWSADSLFVLFEVRDADLRAFQVETDHPQLFLDDMAEVLIDGDNDKTPYWHEDDIVYHINILGTKKDDRGTAGHQSDASWDGRARYEIEIRGTVNDSTDVDEGYTILIAFPWPEIGQTPRPGLRLGVNFANGDNDGKGRQLYNWCDSDPMRSPDTFGTLILME